MATTGILRADDVVFYHPLDDATEYTQSQAWTGLAAYSVGKIGDANSAIAGDAVSYGTGNEIQDVTSGWCGAWQSSIAEISSTQALVGYSDGTNVLLAVATVSGFDITVGPGLALIPDTKTARVSIAALGAGKFAVSYYSGTVQAVVATVSGTDVTVGSPISVDAGSSLGSVAPLSSTSAVCQYHSSGQKVRILTVSGTDVTAGPEASVSGDSGPTSVVSLSPTSAVAVWQPSGVKCAALSVSGTAVTVGSEIVVTASPCWDNPHNCPAAVGLDTTKFVVSYSQSGLAAYGPRFRVGVVSGLSVTLGTEADANMGGYTVAIARISSTSFMSMSANEWARAVVGNVSGTDITLGAYALTNVSVPSSGAPAIGIIGGSTAVLLNGTYLGSGRPVKIGAGIIDAGASDLDAATPGAYPACTGDDRVAVAMWASKLGASSSTATVQRDYTVVFTATTISLGPSAAVWSDAAIGTLMSTMAAGEHFLVLDFEYAGSGSWTLKTSLDGAAFMSQGAQDSGSRDTAPASLAPGVDIVNGVGGQWIDELVMWSGDKTAFESFTTQELANLNDLGDTFGETMDQFEENFGAPVCWQATARMPDGTVWRDFGSGPCPPVVRVPSGAADIVVTDGGNPARPRITEG